MKVMIFRAFAPRAAAATAILGFGLSTAVAGAAAPRSCAPAGSHVLAHDAEASVYTPAAQSGTLPVARAVDGCASGRPGHMVLLAPATHPGGGHSLGEFRLAGRIVGYVERQFGVDSGSSRLVVADLGAGRFLRSIALGSYVDAGMISSEGLSQFALTAHGSVAWIVERSEHRQPVSVTLRVAPRHGAVKVLDTGLAIDPRSLRLAAGTLHWKRAGVERSAQMP